MLKDWAFTQGSTVVKENSLPKQVVLHCIHHDKPQNTRKTEKTDRKRAWTASLLMGKNTIT